MSLNTEFDWVAEVIRHASGSPPADLLSAAEIERVVKLCSVFSAAAGLVGPETARAVTIAFAMSEATP